MEMMKLTKRERLLMAFRGKPVDRIPISPWIYKNLVYEFHGVPPDKQKWRENDHISEMAAEVYKFFDFDVLDRLGTPWHVYNEKNSNSRKWIVDVFFKSEKDKDIEITTIKTPERKLRQIKQYVQVSRYTYVEAILEYFIKERKDFDQFVSYQPPFSPDEEFYNLTKSKKVIGNDGLVVSCMDGVFNTVSRYYRKRENLLIDAYEDEKFYREMMRYFGDRITNIAKQMVNYGADVIEFAANLASGDVGPTFFEKFVLEYEKIFIKNIHLVGAFDIYHNCGNARSIMHIYNKLGTNAWGYLTPSPFGDVDLDEALRAISKDIVLIGNIDQIKFMVEVKPSDVKKKVKEILEKAKKRGNFILSTTDWFSDGTPYENIKAFVEAGLEYGRYFYE